MVALAIILGIIALFALILNVRIKLTVELRDELFLTLSFLGLKYRIMPRKPHKYKLRHYTPKKIAKRDAKAAKEAQLKAEKKARRDAEKKQKEQAERERKSKLTKAQLRAERKRKLQSLPPIPDMFSLFFDIIKLFFSGLFKKFHFHVDRLRIRVGGEDAAQIALVYVAITQGLHPLCAFLDKHSNLHGVKKADIEISTDYLSESIAADVKVAFSTSIGGVLGAAIKVAFKALVGWIRISPKSSTSAVSQQTEQPSEQSSDDPTSQVQDALSSADGDKQQ